MKHIRGLDGLRALSVLSVMFYHLGWPAFSLGWAGVPFFFVLSGFLITGILLDSKGESAGSFFGRFYIRRTLRIFPLYYLYLGVVYLWCLYVHAPAEGWWYYLTYLQNFYLLATNFHWVPGQETGHTWSLAVEEQFYLLWPLALYFTKARYLKLLAVGMVIVAIGGRYVMLSNWLAPTFALLPSNLDTLGLGALLAISKGGKGFSSMCKGMLVCGAIVLVGIFVTTDHHQTMGDQWYLLALAIFFAGVVGCTYLRAPMILQWPPLAYIGKISYGLYIWHALAYGVVNSTIYNKWLPDPGAAWADLAKIVLTFVFAVASFHLFERPILRLKERLTQSGSVALAPSSGLIERAQ